MSKNQLIEIHNRSSNNKEQLNASKTAVCFHCIQEFPTKQIKEWADNGSTAVCPKCNIDSVIPKTEDITSEILEDMNKTWFGSILPVEPNEKLFSAKETKNG